MPPIRWAVTALLLLAVILGAWVVVAVWRPFDSPTALRSSPSVVVAVRDLSRLESAEYHIERVIDLRDRQSRLFGLIRSDDAILFVAVGQVTAGVDLAELTDGDVRVDREAGTAFITLPPARVLSVRLDNDRSWVYERSTDLLARRQEDLETRARQEAEKTLEQSALDSGILERARTNAERTVAAFVRSLGYTTVTVTSRIGQ